MRELSLGRQQELVGGDFSWGSFIRGMACGAALAGGAALGPVGVFGAVTVCSALIVDDAS